MSRKANQYEELTTKNKILKKQLYILEKRITEKSNACDRFKKICDNLKQSWRKTRSELECIQSKHMQQLDELKNQYMRQITQNEEEIVRLKADKSETKEYTQQQMRRMQQEYKRQIDNLHNENNKFFSCVSSLLCSGDNVDAGDCKYLKKEELKELFFGAVNDVIKETMMNENFNWIVNGKTINITSKEVSLIINGESGESMTKKKKKNGSMRRFCASEEYISSQGRALSAQRTDFISSQQRLSQANIGFQVGFGFRDSDFINNNIELHGAPELSELLETEQNLDAVKSSTMKFKPKKMKAKLPKSQRDSKRNTNNNNNNGSDTTKKVKDIVKVKFTDSSSDKNAYSHKEKKIEEICNENDESCDNKTNSSDEERMHVDIIGSSESRSEDDESANSEDKAFIDNNISQNANSQESYHPSQDSGDDHDTEDYSSDIEHSSDIGADSENDKMTQTF